MPVIKKETKKNFLKSEVKFSFKSWRGNAVRGIQIIPKLISERDEGVKIYFQLS